MADDLAGQFNAFCNFGAGQKGAASLDGAKFFKMMKDCKVIDKTITRTEVDMVFARAKAKGGRTLDYTQFQQALRYIAEKKDPGDSAGYDKLVTLITGAAGAKVNSQVGAVGGAAAAATGRLTDVSGYTGAHKERFNEDGTGKGKAGRVNETSNSGYVGDYKGEDTYNEGAPKKVKSNTKADDITARLTDSSKYTGAHKERFNDDGTGKGKSGRVNETSGSGYVGNYKGAGTYGK